MKKSGNSHCELGRKAIEECSEDKSACISFQLEAH
jgi:hypothetical protein